MHECELRFTYLVHTHTHTPSEQHLLNNNNNTTNPNRQWKCSANRRHYDASKSSHQRSQLGGLPHQFLRAGKLEYWIICALTFKVWQTFAYINKVCFKMSLNDFLYLLKYLLLKKNLYKFVNECVCVCVPRVERIHARVYKVWLSCSLSLLVGWDGNSTHMQESGSLEIWFWYR